jgi:hypothetical protein
LSTKSLEEFKRNLNLAKLWLGGLLEYVSCVFRYFM